jgi:hypothetical protein
MTILPASGVGPPVVMIAGRIWSNLDTQAIGLPMRQISFDGLQFRSSISYEPDC